MDAVLSPKSLHDDDGHSFLPTTLLQFAVGFALGLFSDVIRRRFFPSPFATTRTLNAPFLSGEEDDDDDDGDENAGMVAENAAMSTSLNEPHKLVLCVRTDLKMQKGKIAAQVGHATLGAYKAAARWRTAALRVWERNAQPKIALQVASRAAAMRLQETAKRLGLVTYVVYDAGRTQIAAGSMTVLAVGPGPASAIDQVTGSLKLL